MNINLKYLQKNSTLNESMNQEKMNVVEDFK